MKQGDQFLNNSILSLSPLSTSFLVRLDFTRSIISPEKEETYGPKNGNGARICDKLKSQRSGRKSSD